MNGGLAKLAASFDARRSKQYWQMLKRMYGGSDEAIEAIRKSGDSGIYHGTQAENVKPILEQGFQLGREGVHGKRYGSGTYFASKDISDYYTGRETPGVVRLAKPSELSGTKELYPNPSKVMKFTDEPDAFRNIKGNLHMLDEQKVDALGGTIDEVEMLRRLKEIRSKHVPLGFAETELPKTSERYKLQYYGKSDSYDNPLMPLRDEKDFVVVNESIKPSLLRSSLNN